MSRILVVGVHPDDETLGCGATLLKHRAAGDELYWLLATRREERFGFSTESVIRTQNEIDAITRFYGFRDMRCLGLPPMGVETIPMAERVNLISQAITDWNPEILYLPFAWDVHSDHRATFEAAFACTKAFRHPSVRRILMMETPSESDFAPALPAQSFAPNWFEDCTDHLEAKLVAMSLYPGEMGPHPFPRSAEGLRALATVRGAACGCRFAEAFMLLKERR
ncbi:MAG: PIG-L family deacetylase [Magnetococcales bacterium]|nr:PIG-L family deacetylase [Magnetococcales bacterium]